MASCRINLPHRCSPGTPPTSSLQNPNPPQQFLPLFPSSLLISNKVTHASFLFPFLLLPILPNFYLFLFNLCFIISYLVPEFGVEDLLLWKLIWRRKRSLFQIIECLLVLPYCFHFCALFNVKLGILWSDHKVVRTSRKCWLNSAD